MNATEIGSQVSITVSYTVLMSMAGRHLRYVKPLARGFHIPVSGRKTAAVAAAAAVGTVGWRAARVYSSRGAGCRHLRSPASHRRPPPTAHRPPPTAARPPPTAHRPPPPAIADICSAGSTQFGRHLK